MSDTRTFESLGLSSALLRALETSGYTVPTPIQAQAIPLVLDAQDLLGAAQTGTGKTAAFGLPMLQRLSKETPPKGPRKPRALVLVPTRELAVQVADSLKEYGRHLRMNVTTIFGGAGMQPQIENLKRGVDILVACPGRLLDHMDAGHAKLDAVEVLVLDEADRMLDMGFADQIRDITRQIPRTSQKLLFSATFPDAIRALAKSMLRDPAEVSVVGAAHAPAIEQRIVDADPARKAQLLAALLLEHRPESCVVFCNMRRDVDSVAGSLAHYGFDALALHGDMEQRDRAETLLRFANRSCTVLVASDVAARGLDIDDLALVVNYDVPSDPDTYLHRTGRTGRAGREGLALTLCTPQERVRMEAIEDHLQRMLPRDRVEPVEGRPKGVTRAAMATLRIDGGKSDKLRPGDILGALTGDAGLSAKSIGKIDVQATRSYVAITRAQAPQALARLREGKIKGRRFRVATL